MNRLIQIVKSQIDQKSLDNLLNQLRMLDNELDIKIEDIHEAQRNVSVLDRINIFTISDTELALKEENLKYRDIRHRHALVVEDIKDLIRDAIYRDFSVALKVQTGLVAKSIAALRVEHRWGIGVKEHHYYIGGIEELRDRLGRLADSIDAQYHFPTELIDADKLLDLVYDDILRTGGFIE